jgi:hypothetical protein
MSDGIGLSGYAALTRPTMLVLQAGVDNKAAAAALLPKPAQPCSGPLAVSSAAQPPLR